MWVTKSAQTQRNAPESMSATWNKVRILGSLAPPSTRITSAIHQSSESVLPQITVIPALTDRKIGSWAAELWRMGEIEPSAGIVLDWFICTIAIVLMSGLRQQVVERLELNWGAVFLARIV